MRKEVEDNGSHLPLLFELQNIFDNIDVMQIQPKSPLSFGCVIARNDDTVFKKLSEPHQNNLKELLGLPYQQFETSNDVSDMVQVVLEKTESTETKEMMHPLQFLSSAPGREEFEDACIMHKILDAM